MNEKNPKYEFLQFVEFSAISFWDVKRLTFEHTFSSNFNFIKLGKMLTPISEKIKKNEYDGSLKVVAKVSFDEGKIYLREKNETGMDIYKLYNGDLLVSNINFHQGALAINNFGEDIVCSTHYQPYRVNEELVNKDFLTMVLRTKYYKNYIINQKNNGIKTESKFSFIKDLEIPLPPLAEQQRIVADYNSKKQLAQTKSQQAKTLEQEIEKYLMTELGIEISESKKEKGKMYFMEMKDLERWDVWNLGEKIKAKFEVINFSKAILSGPMYGANTKSIDQITDTRYIRITDINEDGTLNNDIVSAETVEEKYLLEENDFLIARSGNTVGKTFLYSKKHGKALFAGYLVKYKPNLDLINPQYLFYYSKSTVYKNWIKSNQRISGQPNINGQEYLSFPLILPPLSVQNSIVSHIQSLKSQINNLNQEMKELEKNAVGEFEGEIFSL